MASRTGFVYTERFLDHKTGPGHPERPERLRAIVSHLKEVRLASILEPISIEPASEDWISKVHTPAHIRFVRETCLQGGILDQGDTPVSKDSYEVALLAAGGVIAAVAAVLNGAMENAFCAVRPPGHHATRAESMGFCLFNNAAIGARYAQAGHGLSRVAIVDWDVHHGNGTQEIFYEDKSVFYISTHQYPFYPGTGSRTETGSGEGHCAPCRETATSCQRQGNACRSQSAPRGGQSGAGASGGRTKSAKANQTGPGGERSSDFRADRAPRIPVAGSETAPAGRFAAKIQSR